MSFGIAGLFGGASGGGGITNLFGGAVGGGGGGLLGGLSGGSSGGGSPMPDIGKMFGVKIDPMHMLGQCGKPGQSIVKWCGGKTGQTVLPIAGKLIGSIWGPMGSQIGSMAGQQAASDAVEEKANLARKAAAKRNSIWV